MCLEGSFVMVSWFPPLWTKNLKTAFKKFEAIWSTDHIGSIFLRAVFHKFYLVHSLILCPKCICFYLSLPPISNSYQNTFLKHLNLLPAYQAQDHRLHYTSQSNKLKIKRVSFLGPKLRSKINSSINKC